MAKILMLSVLATYLVASPLVHAAKQAADYGVGFELTLDYG
jgi:hypothetical protein